VKIGHGEPEGAVPFSRGTSGSNPRPSRDESANFRSPETHYIATDHTAPLAGATYRPIALCRRGRRALPAVKQVWVSLAAQADKEGWPARFLAALAEHEIAERSRRRLASAKAFQDRLGIEAVVIGRAHGSMNAFSSFRPTIIWARNDSSSAAAGLQRDGVRHDARLSAGSLSLVSMSMREKPLLSKT
jgi:hypothetical protein